MKKKVVLALTVLFAAVILTACGKGKEADPAPFFEPEVTEIPSQQETEEQPEEETAPDTGTDVITEDQAYAAVINYNRAIGSGIDGEINSEGYSEYWEVSEDEAGEIVVLYRSYTAAQTRYYVNPVTGETYVTEFVPGVMDEEQSTGETFNARDYLEGPDQLSGAVTAAADSSPAPVEYETADGVMGSFLLASDRDKIDTTNDYGVFYRVIYEASLEGDELTACGSMDYRNSRDQDPITISSDLRHVFKVDENTVYQKAGEQGTETISREEFAEYLETRKDSGMYFEVQISGGVVTTVLLAAQ